MAKLQRHAVGHPVTFSNPTTGARETGRILDEVWAKEPHEFSANSPDYDGWREGAFVAQLIEWPGGYRSIRITYYLRPKGGDETSWYFGGQYAPSMSLDEFRDLFRKLSAKNW